MWGTLGIGYRKSKVEASIDSWKPLLDSDQYRRQAFRCSAMPRTSSAAPLKYLGYSFNSTDPAQMKQAEELLIKQKKNIKVFADDNGQDLLASGEVDLCMEWNGDVIQVMAEDKDIAYAVPTEGTLLWQDCMCIPNGAPHPENAHAFLTSSSMPRPARKSPKPSNMPRPTLRPRR